MKTSMITSALGVMALFAASAGSAATVTITPSVGPGGSPGVYNVGDTFTIDITANVPNTFATTMELTYDATKVTYVSIAALAPWNFASVGGSPLVINVETPSATAANPAVYNVARLTFQAIAKGAANIVINDDGGNVSGWFDANTADYIPNTYTQANVQVIPVPAAAWLFVSALGGLATLKRRGLA